MEVNPALPNRREKSEIIRERSEMAQHWGEKICNDMMEFFIFLTGFVRVIFSFWLNLQVDDIELRFTSFQEFNTNVEKCNLKQEQYSGIFNIRLLYTGWSKN